MTKNIIQATDEFEFDKLSLNQPYAIQGGSYFTKLLCEGEQLYIQTPKCSTKQGIVKSGQKIYTDLVFTQTDAKFIDWIERLEATLHSLIYEKRSLWFHNELDMTDIETAFASPVKVFKSGTSYLIRCNLGKLQGLNSESPVRIFNENEMDLKITDVTVTTPVISILEISGVRFSSRSFHLDLNIKQMMVIQSAATFDRCLIDPHATTINANADVDADANADADGTESEDSYEQLETPVVEEAVTDGVTQSPDNKQQNNQPTHTESNEDTNESNDKQQDRTLIDTTPVDSTSTIACDTTNTNNSDTPINDVSEHLEEVVLDCSNIKDTVELKTPNEVYMQLYLQAREKAKLARRAAIEAYMEAKNIKKTYLLDDLDESDDDSFTMD